ncbi:MAG TPA: hypothetical protein VFJ28_05135, partial [Marmoricola sp.]|nr:hypothetical protein [Marmoricola sp.]
EAVRAINHQTITAPPLPAPCVYDVLGDLKRLGYGLDQATAQLAARLVDSTAVFDLYECDGGDPTRSIEAAVAALTAAADHAQHVGALLDDAQSAIAGQGYRT